MTAMTTGPGFRLARSAIFAAVCVVTTALGHALMSGDTLPGWAVGYAFAGVTSAAWWLTGRERGALFVTGATVGTQLVLHSLFALSQLVAVTGTTGTPATDATATGLSSGSGRMSAAMAAVHSAPGMGMDPGGHAWSPHMVLAHLLAALVCAVWMWRGEAAAFRLGRVLAAFVYEPLRLVFLLLLAPVRPAFRGPVRLRAVFGPVRRPRGPALRHIVIRRGPPAGLSCS